MRIFILAVMCLINIQSVFAMHVYAINDPANIPGKREILKTLAKDSLELRSLALAVASIETEHFKVDYAPGDGKRGGAYNLSIFKFNKDQILWKYPRTTKTQFNSIHSNISVATAMFRSLVNAYGHEFLYVHRGGIGYRGIDPSVINSYINAVRSLQIIYLSKPSELHWKTTTGLRYTIAVDKI